jgi:hypothetical protein
MKIHRFTFEAEWLREFVDFPWTIYADDPRWIPPSREEVRRLLAPENPFFRYGEALNLLVTEGGRTLGRCSAMINPKLKQYGSSPGLIGFFEVVDRYEVSEALLTEAVGWLRKRGLEEVWGPMNFSTWHSYRLMTRGFDRDPFYGEPYNPPYYPEHFDRFGFESTTRHYSWDLGEEHLRELHANAKQFSEAVPPRDEFRCESLDPRRLEADLRRIYDLAVPGFRGNFGWSPIDWGEFEPLYTDLRHTVIPDLVRFAVTPAGQTVGLFYLYPDPAIAVRSMNGESGLLARLRFSMRKQRSDRMIFHTMVIDEPFRKAGIVEHTAAPLIEAVLGHGFRRAVGALAKEGPTIYAKTGPPSREYTLFRVK